MSYYSKVKENVFFSKRFRGSCSLTPYEQLKVVPNLKIFLLNSTQRTEILNFFYYVDRQASYEPYYTKAICYISTSFTVCHMNMNNTITCFQISVSSSNIGWPWLLHWVRELFYIRRKILQWNYYSYPRCLKSRCLWTANSFLYTCSPSPWISRSTVELKTHSIVPVQPHSLPYNLMMWDSPLYAVKMFYYHWLIKRLLWPVAE